jgi:hypothetical protein
MIKTLLRVVVGGLLVISVVLGLSFMSLQGAGAATPQESACLGSGGTWDAGAGKCTTPNDPRTVSGTIQQVGNILIFIVGAVSVLMVIIGGLRYALAQGDSNAVNSAKNTVIYAIVGIIVSAMAYGLVNFVIVQLK